MRTLQFSVNGQQLNKVGDFSKIVRGSKNYLKCQFNFEGSDWNNCKVAAVFESGGSEYPAIVDSSRCCIVPDQVTDSSAFKVRVVGKKNNYQITTNKVLITQEG